MTAIVTETLEQLTILSLSAAAKTFLSLSAAVAAAVAAAAVAAALITVALPFDA